MLLINGKSGFFFQRSPYYCALGLTVRQILVTINKSIRHLYTCTFTRRLTVSSMNRIRHCLLGKTLKKTPTFYTSYYISNELVLYWVVQIYIDKNSTYLQCSTISIWNIQSPIFPSPINYMYLHRIPNSKQVTWSPSDAMFFTSPVFFCLESFHGNKTRSEGIASGDLCDENIVFYVDFSLALKKRLTTKSDVVFLLNLNLNWRNMNFKSAGTCMLILEMIFLG